jgi:hypothetical protein
LRLWRRRLKSGAQPAPRSLLISRAVWVVTHPTGKMIRVEHMKYIDEIAVILVVGDAVLAIGFFFVVKTLREIRAGVERAGPRAG